MQICDSAVEASACFTRLNDLKTSKGSSVRYESSLTPGIFNILCNADLRFSIFCAMHICDSAVEASACFTKLNDLKTLKGSSVRYESSLTPGIFNILCNADLRFGG